MKNTIPFLLVITIALFLASCTSTVSLTGNAKSILEKMTDDHAELLIDQWSQPTASRGGLCLTGAQPSAATLDYETSPVVEDSKVSFFAYYAAINGSSTGDTVDGAVQSGSSVARQQSTVDLRLVREVRVVETSADDSASATVLEACQGFKPGYQVVITSEESLPSGAQLTLNATDQQQLDYLLALIKFYSPQARVVGGVEA